MNPKPFDVMIAMCLSLFAFNQKSGFADVASTEPRVDLAFLGNMRDVLFVDENKHGFVLTSLGLYECQADPHKWEVVLPIIDGTAVQIAGGNSKGLFLLVEDLHPPKDRTMQLCMYSAGNGLQLIRRIPAQGVGFVSDQKGAFLDGRSIQATEDGGKTWSTFPVPSYSDGRPLDISCLNWVSPDLLLVADGQYLALIDIPTKGKTSVRWHVRLDVEQVAVATIKDQLWVGEGTTSSFELATGKKHQSIETEMADSGGVSGIASQNSFLWAWNLGGARLYTIADKPVGTTVWDSPVVKIIPYTQDGAILFGLNGKIFDVNTSEVKPKAMMLQVNNTLIEKKKAEADAITENGKPSVNEIKIFGEWAQKAGETGQEDVFRGSANQTFATQRDRILWATKELQRYCEEHPEAATQK